jgi:hypothetical protein
MSEGAELQAALHGTSLGAVSKIIRNRGFTEAKTSRMRSVESIAKVETA